MVFFTYQRINNIAAFGHFLSAISMIYLYSNTNQVIIPLTESFLEWKKFI